MEFNDPTKRAALLAEAEAAAEAAAGQKAPDGEQGTRSEKDGDDVRPATTDEEMMKELEEAIEREEADIFLIDNVFDAGGGEPLFANFAVEDWALLSLRFELHLLVHSFRRDCRNPERRGIQPSELGAYYYRYFSKGLNVRNYGIESIEQLIGLIPDSVVTWGDIIESQLIDDLETNEVFVKLTEESRRERQRRLDEGDQSALLRFSVLPQDYDPLAWCVAGRTGQRPSQGLPIVGRDPYAIQRPSWTAPVMATPPMVGTAPVLSPAPGGLSYAPPRAQAPLAQYIQRADHPAFAPGPRGVPPVPGPAPAPASAPVPGWGPQRPVIMMPPRGAPYQQGWRPSQ